MATDKQKKFGQYDGHTVGNLNSWKIRTLAHGAKCAEDIDNFTIVELGYDENGQRIAKQLTDVTKKGYLIASPERRYLGENIDEFYNGAGEYARIIYLDEGLRFETSAFTGEDIENGDVAHFDPATKKFIVHDGSHEDYENARDKYEVVGIEDDVDYRFTVPVIRLEVMDDQNYKRPIDAPVQG